MCPPGALPQPENPNWGLSAAAGTAHTHSSVRAFLPHPSGQVMDRPQRESLK